jgi:glycosyltransferase involved in cell wall biosynthesis
MMPIADPGEGVDVTLRITFPYDFSSSKSRTTAVFGTLEQQMMRTDQLADPAAFDALCKSPSQSDLKIVTPSRWSAEGFYRAGFVPDQVLVVPHGVDIATFRPMPALRQALRGSLGVGENQFVFLSVGAMTGNKGIDLLLRAFAKVCQRFPESRLVLKGVDPLYKSKDLLAKTLQLVPAEDRRCALDKIVYLGDSVSTAAMAQLYQVADVYVTPYRAEGFNLPVLEAAACGVPVICTEGGPTDDFVIDAFARKIASRKISKPWDGLEGSALDPDLDHLIALMEAAITDHAWREYAAEAGPKHVIESFTWDSVVDTLVQKLFPEQDGLRALS